MRGGRLAASHASPCAIGSPDGQPESPCMSWQRSGATNVYWATEPCTSAWPVVNGTWCAAQSAFDLDGGLPAVSWKKMNGLCLAAYMPVELTGQVPDDIPSMTPIQLTFAAVICVER